MSQRKRSGPFQDTDSEDQDASSQDSSLRKRRRGNDGTPIRSTPPSEDERQSPPTTPPSDDEQMSEDEEESSPDAQQVTAEDNEPADYGILESVHVINFMCHENEKWELSPLINFMCGKNGSGKSAILTAIIMCLGGKAAATGRGTKLQDYIRNGAKSATVICCLKNQSANAFKHDEYGDSISVERSWSQNIQDKTTSSFIIRNANGKKMASTKAELDEILDHFCLQMENPLNVLTQDQARHFITVSTPEEKYKAFLRGVLLEQLDQDYKIIEDIVDNMGPKLKNSEDDMGDKKNLRDAASAKLELSERQHTNRERLAALRHQLIWAQVEESEVVRDKLLAEIAEFDGTIAAEQSKHQALTTELERVDDRFDAKKAEIATATADVDAAKQTKAEADTEQKAKAEALRSVHNEEREIRGVLQTLRKDKINKTKEIQDEESRLAEIDGGGAAQRRREFEELRITSDEADTAQKTHATAEPELRQDREAAKTNMAEAQTRFDEQHEEVKKRKLRLRDIRGETNQPDSRFHHKMSELLRDINQERRFREKPIGPIGKHVTLLEPKFGSIIEKVFGATLSGFVVSHKEDDVLLHQLMRKYDMGKISVNIASTQPINVDGKEPDEQYLTILRALRIDNVQVRNVLIIVHHIECSILVEDFDNARAIMDPRDRKRNVKRCYTFQPGSSRRGIFLHFKGPNPAQDPVAEFQGRLRMNANVEDQIRVQEDSVTESENTLQTFERQLRQCRKALEDAEAAVRNHGKQAKELRLKKDRIEAALQDKQNDIDADDQAGGALDTMRIDLTELEKKIELQANLFQDHTVLKDQRTEEERAAKAAQKEAVQRLNELARISETLRTELQKIDGEKTAARVAANTCLNSINDKQAGKENFAEHLEKAETEVREMTESAGQSGSERVPVPPNETLESLNKKWLALEQQILAAERNVGGTHEQVQAQATAAAKKYLESKRHYNGLIQLYSHLVGSLKERKRRWKYFRAHIGKSARASFIHLLSQRGFRGKLVIDHQQHLLELKIEPDITKKDGAGRSARTLSGGEKTFAQICLLLALWEAMGSPLRCLDEFDVYMDAVNRNMSINLLIDAARQSQGRQYILISPGTKSDIKPAPDVHAFEVAPPERGQQRINFPRAAAAA